MCACDPIGKISAGQMFLRGAIEKILAEKEIRKSSNAELKKACETSLEELKNDENGENGKRGGIVPDGQVMDAVRHFIPFELACKSKNPRIAIIALDCLQKLISYGHLSGNKGDPSNPGRAMNDRIVGAVCSAFNGEGTDEAVLLQLLKAILAVILSSNCSVHEVSLLTAVRTSFAIFLVTKNAINEATARGILSQVMNAIFGAMEAHGDEKDDDVIVREVVDGLVARIVENDGNEREGSNVVEGDESVRGGSIADSEHVGEDFHFANVYQKDAFLVFRALCVLSKKEEGDANDPKDTHLRSKLLALEMLLLILQNSGPVLQNLPPFVSLVKRVLCIGLSKNAISPILPVFEKSLAIFLELMHKFKVHLKLQIEVFFKEIILSLLDSSSCTSEHRWILLNTVSKVVSTPQAVVEMFVNYDCDITSHNVFAGLVAVISKTARTSVVEKDRDRAMRLLGLRCLVDILQCQVDWFELAWEAVDGDHVEDATLNNTVYHLEHQKQKKDLMEQGIFLFARKPKEGLKFLQEKGFVGTEATEIAEFLLKEERLDKTVVGDYLGDPDEFNKKVMYAYVDDLEFSNRDFVSSLRLFLEKFRLPGEAQKIDRLMEKFASRYCECNPSLGLFASADTAYVLAYSIIMLTTDLHSAQVRKKMTKENYVNMNRGINNGGDLPRELLESIYDDIANDEIKMKAGASKLLKSQTTGVGPRKATAHVELEAMSETARVLMESAVHSDSNFIVAAHQEHVRPMFKICWTPSLAAFSMGLQQSQDEDEWRLCLKGFHLGIRIAALLGMATERNAFIQALGRFTLLTARSQLGEMREKNIEAMKLLLLIGDECGNLLEDNWVEVFTCISQLELASLIGTGLKHGDSTNYVAKSTGRDGRTLSTLQGTLLATASQDVVVAVDRIFHGSSRLSGDAIVHFVRALCSVSNEELSLPAGPRMFLLGKIVDVAFYNMDRIRLELSRVWSVVGDHLNAAGCSSDEDISHFSIDALRQLAIKFIEKGELPNFRFQKEFLRPFELIMARNRSPSTRELVVVCCSHLVESHASRIKSGWTNLFCVWTSAATDQHMEIVQTAFNSVSSVIGIHLSTNFGSLLDSFQEALKCLAEFACNQNVPDMSMEAIRLIRHCAVCVSENEEQIVDAPWEEKFSMSGEQRIWLRGWFPIFFELSCIINRCKLDVRTRSLTVLFEILKNHGDSLRPEWWGDLFRIIFRIFEHVKQDDGRNDKKEWMATTCNHAMYALVDVFTQFYPTIHPLLPSFYDQFVLCIQQRNEQLARSSVNCLENIVQMNGTQFSEEMWKKTVDLMCWTLSSPFPADLNMNEDEVEGMDDRSVGAIVMCVVQGEMVEAVANLLLGGKRGDSMYSLVSVPLIFSLCQALAECHRVATTFNAKNAERRLLWKAGLRGTSKPKLCELETRSLDVLLSLLLRLLSDPRAEFLRPEVTSLLSSSLSSAVRSFCDSESVRPVLSPVLTSFLSRVSALPRASLPLLGASFPASVVALVVPSESLPLRTSLSDVLRILLC